MTDEPKDVEEAEKRIEAIRKESEATPSSAAPRYTAEEAAAAREKFSDPRLLHHIWQELDKTHVGDDKEKVLAFLCAATALIKPEYRSSFRVCGDSTSGKDNLIRTVLRHMPEGTFSTYTGTSDKFLLRLIDATPGIYVGELNLQRQGGANQNILEVLKAAADGGTNYGFLDKDEHGRCVSNENTIERRVVIYSGVEIRQDDELSNRVLSISVSGSDEQTKAVLDRLVEDDSPQEKGESWISIGLSMLDRGVDVIIPKDVKAVLVKFADKSNVRARRDIKRLFALVKASAFLHQKQRPRLGNNVCCVVADVYHVLRALGDTLDRTYSLMEPRLQKVVDAIEELGGDGWVMKRDVAKKAGLRGKNRQADTFSALVEQHIIDEQQCKDDRRFYEVRLTGRKVAKFIQGSFDDMIEAMPSSVTVKIKPIGPVASTDVEKTGLERVEIGIDKYPAIDFISGSTYTAATPETSLNPIKPIAKPNIESTDVEKHDGYSKFGFECDPKGAVLAKIRESKVPLDMVELEFWALDNKKVACADVFFEVIRQLRTEGLIFEPSPDKVAAVGSMGTGE